MGKCEQQGCLKNAYYGLVGKRARFCAKHKHEGMINVVQKSCEKEGCNKRACFGLPNQPKRFCGDHKKDGMINPYYKLKPVEIKKPKYVCQTNGCQEKAKYGLKHGDKPLHCKNHKTDTMVNWCRKRVLCHDIECRKHALYNLKGEKPKYCYDHKEKNMVIVTCKLCEEEGCTKSALFGKKRGKIKFCGIHKTQDMINLKKKTCADPKCIKTPSYNFEGNTGLYCAEHKKEGMIEVNNAKCKHPNCKERAKYGTERRKPLYCKDHKKDGMLLGGIIKHCITCDIVIHNTKYKSYCKTCYYKEYIEELFVSKNKDREDAVAEFVVNQFDNYEIILDQRIEGGNSKHRPDILFDVGTHIVIIEVDECQHKSHSKAREDARLLELFKDVGSRPIHIIRFNPDDYTNKAGIGISTCWSYSKTDQKSVVKKNKQEEWKKRLEVLSDYIIDGLLSGGNDDIEKVYLFYDGWEF